MLKYFSLSMILPILLFAESVVDAPIKPAQESKKDDVPLWKYLDDMDEAMHRVMQSIRKQAEEDFSTMTTIFDSRQPSSRQLNMQIHDDADYVIVGLEGLELSDQAIEIKAKGDNLEGSLVTKSGGHVAFKVVLGRSFELVYKIESKKSEDKNGKQFQSLATSTSMQSEYLPVQVGNLEETIVSLKDNQLTLKLPKYNQKKDWKKITVK